MCVPGDGGAEHVLLIDGFSPMMKTKDLEDLIRPCSGQGVSIRWIDDTSAAAVFRTPALGNGSSGHFDCFHSHCFWVPVLLNWEFVWLSTARQALAGIRDPRIKVHKYTEAGASLGGQYISLSVTGGCASRN